VIRLLHWAPGSQQATDEDPRDLSRVRRSGWVWLDLSGNDTESLPEYSEAFDLEPHHVEDALSESRFSMLEETPDYLFTILFGYLTGAGHRLMMTRMTVLVGDDFLITASRDDMPGVRWVHEQIAEGATLPNASPIELLASLALAGTRRVNPLIQELEEQIDLLEELAIEADPRTITQAYALRRDVILLRRSLVPQKTVYEDLSSARHRIVDDTVAADFWRVAHQQAQALESLAAAQSLLESVLEIHRGAVADQTNEIVRVLTVFSAVMLPLGLIAGMWGMNFIDIPGAEERWGFWILVGAMALLALGLWLYFARRGFVGAPRLRDLPKAAGLGLIQVGVAPIKVVAGGIESTMRFVGLRESQNDVD
jgi:magnesium transporter